MKYNHKLHAALAAIAVTATLTACSDDDDTPTPPPAPDPTPEYTLRTLTFEDADTRFSPYELTYAGKTITKWSDLIDSKQYEGPLLYGDQATAAYRWADEGNTFLAGATLENYDTYCFWNGGHAISDYASTDLDNCDYTQQLAVYGEGGNNSSANFCIQNGYASEFASIPPLTFADGKARVIDHLYVAPTTYAMTIMTKGSDMCEPAGDDDFVHLAATGIRADGSLTATLTFNLHEITGWTKWDLAPLGEITSLEIDIKSSMTNDYGMAYPGYFAIDDISVRFPTEK